ncbi:hypothetical protein HN803_08045 [candidate division WWE3 bacterium]|nr:hypothetical protein [candidate division WWE3 bacterium]MBT7350704.1 hypothetical protein [candidate division WWE3 bacterium]
MTQNLSPELLNELKNSLDEKKIDLDRELVLLAKEDSFADPDRTVGNAEEADEASEETSHIENDLKEDVANKSLGLVEKAIAKIEAGNYGICEVGGEAIGEDRLKAMPEAENCVAHEKADEAVEIAEDIVEKSEE